MPTRAVRPGDREEMEVLAPLLERIRERAEPDQAERVARFAWATFRRVSPEQLSVRDLSATAAMLIDGFEFIDGRRDEMLALRVFDATREQHGWQAPGTVVEVNVEDGPFLLTTVTEELNRLGLEVAEVLHPVFGVLRDDEGHVLGLLPARQADARESFLHVLLVRHLDEDGKRQVTERLRAVLDDARAATRDFPRMREQLDEIAFQTRAAAGARYRGDEVDEAVTLLSWLLDDHFVFLGYREYDLIDTDEGKAVQVRSGSGLGILSDDERSSWAQPVALSTLSPGFRRRVEGGDLLIVSRTNRTSTVHRQVRMVYIGIKKVGGDGEIHGEYRFIGLFAQKAFAEPASSIPVLRRKLRQILEREDIVDHSYDERALRSLFEAFPKPELFVTGVDALRRTLVELLEIQKGQRVRVLVRESEDGRSVSALVAIPRERFNATNRQRVQQLLTERFDATEIDYHLTLTERDQALLHFVIHAPKVPAADVATDELERAVASLSRTWADELLDELIRVHGDTDGRRLAKSYAGMFPAGYAETTSVETALLDIHQLEGLCVGWSPEGVERLECPEVAMMLRPDRDDPNRIRFTLYKVGHGVELSMFLPILESLGLTVVEEIPFRLKRPKASGGPDELHIHDFVVRSDNAVLDAVQDGPRVADAALAIWERRAEADSLNRLVVRAGLTWDEVAILRAYRRYRRQVGTTFTEAYLDEALVDHPAVASSLIDLFDAMFDPVRAAPEEEVEGLREQVIALCDQVERLDADRILRNYLGMIDATLRTNRWVERGETRGSPALALKFDSARVPDMPKPVPYREIFVCNPDMEGVHLRGGPVARGGLRWSDRIEDFRTEVLGLMKAQMVKNAVIVPTGSKGGYVLKRGASGGPPGREEVQRQYEVFVQGLLDVTDNVATAQPGDHMGAEDRHADRGAVLAPENVRRRDGDDAYLVVAADRGTATFSDVANAISAAYDFWLGDAFASGGSRGYDHKEMGITARGAWVAVQRHFRELGIDVQSEPITVVGIGDMSGDVFGNGMLSSEVLRVVSAFDHRDIFLDPDPDVRAAFAERQRLFALPRSSWQDYDASLISEGGGVFPRSLKSIPLSEQVRALLRVEQDSLSPPDLIRAILGAPVDLLFAGGIGTFVKSSEESHAEVGDRANDAIRVDATAVGARVLGEGGNLAVTQRGRIQYARRGGRINTDAIDNSAGVDTSDHEVNLKILLALPEADDTISADERDEELAAVEDEVAALVLRDNALQTWVLSYELSSSQATPEAFEGLMADLVAAGALDRDVEVLPSSAEMRHRREAGAGLTRPELAVLLGYAKVDLRGRVVESPLVDQPYLQRVLREYFPEPVVERFGSYLEQHRLRREIIATVVANDLVNRLGITYVNRTSTELGVSAEAVAAAYWIAREVSDADSYWRAVETLDQHVDAAVQLEVKAEVDRLVDAFVRAYLRDAAGDVGAAVARDRDAFHELEKAIAEGDLTIRRGERRHRIAHYVDLGVDADVAERIVGLSDLTLVPDVAAVARSTGHPVRHVADAFVRVTEALPLDRLGRRLRTIGPEGHWQRWQHRGLLDDLRDLRRKVAGAALQFHDDVLAAEAVERYLDERAAHLGRIVTVLDLLERESSAGLAGIAVAVRTMREILEP